MDRAERIGLGVAVAGHLVLFGLLSVGFLATPNPEKLKVQPIDISLVKDVALEAEAPQAIEAPAQSIAPEEGEPEDAAPPEPAEAEPEPTPPAPAPPKPQPAPPKPEPKPVPAPPKPQPRPKPAPQPKPQPKRPAPAPEKAAPQPKPAPVKKPAAPAPAKPAPAKPAAKPKAAPAKPATPARGSGKSETATATKPRGSRLGDDFLKGMSPEASPSKSEAPRAAKVGAQAAANIASAILRQVQPCANRQVTPGPGAERIRVTINLRLNRDGSLAARPRVTGRDGVDDENRRYVDRVDDLAVATFVGCSPLRGLPAELYDVSGGWSNFNLRYKLPG